MNVKATYNKSDLQRFSRGFARIARVEAAASAARLGRRAVRQLSAFDRRLGHEYLASLWDATPPQSTATGGARVVVYSRAERQAFYNKTSRKDVGRVRSSRHRVEGERLLAILEGGADRHPIAASAGGGRLAIPVPGTEARTRAFVQQYGPGSFLPATEGDTRFPAQVIHPGVAGNQNVRTTHAMLEAGLAAEAAAVAGRIAVNVTRGT